MLNIPDEVKNLFKADNIPKSFHGHFPGGEYADITNDSIVEESVKFTESICSQQYLKFGLAEASQVEFETVGVGNMVGMTIECACEVCLTSLGSGLSAFLESYPVDSTQEWLTPQTVEWEDGVYAYRVPYGRFIVDECPRNHGAIAHRRVKAYSALRETTEYIEWLLGCSYPTEKITLDQGIVNHYLISNSGDIDGQTQVVSTTDATESEEMPHSYAFTVPAHRLGESISMAFTTYTDYREASYTTQNPIAAGLYRLVIDGRETGITTLTEIIRQRLLAWGITFDGMTVEEGARYIAEKASQTVIPSQYNLPETINVDRGRAVYQKRYAVTSGGIVTVYDSGIYVSYSDDTLIYISPSDASMPYHDFYFVKTVLRLSAQWERAGGTEAALFVTSSNAVDVSTAAHVCKVAPTSEMIPDFTFTIDKTGQLYTGLYTYSGALEPLDVIDAALELVGGFIIVGRDGKYTGKVLTSSSPYDLIPDNYSECWWDEYDIDDIGYVIANVHNEDTNAEDTQTYVIGTGQSAYEMGDNYILKNGTTDPTDIITDTFAGNVNAVEFTPLDLTMHGLPYLEAGDYIRVTAEDGAVVASYILRHTMEGVQSLTDTVESTNGAIKTVEEVLDGG